MMSRKAMVKRNGLMEPSMLEPTSMVKNMATVSTNGPTVAYTVAIGTTTRLVDTVNISGMMVVNTKVIGLKTTWKAREFTPGLTVECMRETMSMTKRKAMVLTLTPMADHTKASGRTASKMDKAASRHPTENREEEFGVKEREFDGSKKRTES